MTAKKFGADFEKITLDGYRNINELFKQFAQLHACETLFGDWDAEVMILAQDPANFSKLQELHKDRPDINPYHHDPKIRTNRNLYELMQSLNRFDLGTYENPNNTRCGLYYANAIWLLKDSKDMSGAITSTQKTYDVNKPVFEATLSNLKKLKFILTLGDHSFKFLQNFFKNQIASNWHESVKERRVHKVQYQGSSYLVGSIYHTSTRGMIARAKLDGFLSENLCAMGISLSKTDLASLFKKI